MLGLLAYFADRTERRVIAQGPLVLWDGAKLPSPSEDHGTVALAYVCIPLAKPCDL
jgi:hypothetical protein